MNVLRNALVFLLLLLHVAAADAGAVTANMTTEMTSAMAPAMAPAMATMAASVPVVTPVAKASLAADEAAEGLPDGPQAPPATRFPMLYEDPAPFLAALRAVERERPSRGVTGVAVPHHLLAADLMAMGIKRASGPADEAPVRRVILLCPDHFRRAASPVAVAARGFETMFGPVEADRDAVASLLAFPDIQPSELFSQEHGVQALLPFIKRCMPQAKVVALAVAGLATRAHWERLAEALAPLLQDPAARAVIVQSNDFSHKLSLHDAVERDRETLRQLALPDPAALLSLSQPYHVDSLGTLYAHRLVQQRVHGLAPWILARRDASHYQPGLRENITSYQVHLYATATPAPGPDARRIVMGGDVFLGRAMGRCLAQPARRRAILQDMHRLTLGAPLVVNLEGPLLPACPADSHPYRLCMEQAPSLDILAQLPVAAASLANNHALDHGAVAMEATRQALTAHGVAPLTNFASQELAGLRVTAATWVENPGRVARPELPSPLPDLLFLHWGQEWTQDPSDAEEAYLVQGLGAAPMLVVGAHSHRASPPQRVGANGLRVFLGNLLFDQRHARASGALLFVDVFPGAHIALHYTPLPNLFARRCQGVS